MASTVELALACGSPRAGGPSRQRRRHGGVHHAQRVMQGSCVHHMSLPDAHATLHAAYLDIASSGHQKVGEQQRRRRSSVSESAVSANQKPLDSLTFFLYPFFLPLFFTVSWPRAYPGPGPTQGWGMLPAAIYKTRSVVRDLVQSCSLVRDLQES